MKHKRITEFAASIGVSHTAVRKAIDTGRIPADLIGMKELRGGRKVTIIINPVAARAAYAGTDEPASRDNAQLPLSVTGDADEDEDALPPISKSRRIVEAYKAKMARLEYELKSGKLVDAQEFLAKYSALVVTARTLLFGVPSKAKGRIPSLTADDLGILTSLIRDTLESVADGYPEFDAWFESERPRWLPLISVSRVPADSDAKAFAHHEDHK